MVLLLGGVFLICFMSLIPHSKSINSEYLIFGETIDTYLNRDNITPLSSTHNIVYDNDSLNEYYSYAGSQEIAVDLDDAYFEAGNWDNNGDLIYIGLDQRGYLRFQINETSIYQSNLEIYTSITKDDPTPPPEPNPLIQITLIDSGNCSEFPTGAGDELNFNVTDVFVIETQVDSEWTIFDITELMVNFTSRSDFSYGNYIGLRINSTYVDAYWGYPLVIRGRESGELYGGISRIELYSKKPENITVPAEFLGRYTWDNDVIGQDPDDWIVSEISESDIQVIAEKQNHLTVVEFNATGNNIMTQKFVVTEPAHGVLEFWIMSENISSVIAVVVCDLNYLHSVIFILGMDLFAYLSNSQPAGAPIPNAPTPQNNVWYHVKMAFNTTYWNCSIDNILCSTSLDVFGTPVNYDRCLITTLVMASGQLCYFDAIDYGWTPYNESSDYYEGRSFIPRWRSLTNRYIVNSREGTSLFFQTQKVEFNYKAPYQLYDVGIISNTTILSGFTQTNNSYSQLSFIAESMNPLGIIKRSLQYSLDSNPNQLVRIAQPFSSYDLANITTAIAFKFNSLSASVNSTEFKIQLYNSDETSVYNVSINATNVGVLLNFENESVILDENEWYKLYINLYYETNIVQLILLNTSLMIVDYWEFNSSLDGAGLGMYALAGMHQTNSEFHVLIDYIQFDVGYNYDYSYYVIDFPTLTYPVSTYSTLDFSGEGIIRLFAYLNPIQVTKTPILHALTPLTVYESNEHRLLVRTEWISDVSDWNRFPTALSLVICPNSSTPNVYISDFTFSILTTRLNSTTMFLDIQTTLFPSYPTSSLTSNSYFSASGGNLFFYFNPRVNSFLKWDIIISPVFNLALQEVLIKGASLGRSDANIELFDNLGSVIIPLPSTESPTSYIYTSDLDLEQISLTIEGSSITNGYIKTFMFQLYNEATYSILKLSQFLIPMILIFVPSLAIRKKIGKDAFLPMVFIMTLISFSANLIPLWIMLIVVFAITSIFIERMRGRD